MPKRKNAAGENGKPLKVSRSKIELFLECPRCFWLDVRKGIKRPSGPPFTLNTAVDTLLKKEFDRYRGSGENHPLLLQYAIDAHPVAHPGLDDWRKNMVGVRYLDAERNLLLYGAIDDLWRNAAEEYIVADYKATAVNGEIAALDKAHHQAYKRQMEIYQWLLRKNGLRVSDTCYFVYCNGIKSRERFDNRLEFRTVILPYTGSDDWVEGTVGKLHRCLQSPDIPAAADSCVFCSFVRLQKIFPG